MGDREALLEEARRIQLLKQARAMKSGRAKKPKIEAPPPRELSTMDKVRGGLEAFNQGTTLGWGDELAARGRAAVDYVTNPGDQSWDDRVAMYEADQRGVRDDFKDQYGVEAGILELGGGLASPVTWIPGAGAPAQAGRLTKAIAGVPRAGIEGAVAGAGAADEGDRWGGAETGAKWGLGAGAGLRGLSGLAGAVSSRKVAQELGSGDDFVPIHMADREGMLGDIYRNTIGRAWGAKGKLADQEKPFIDAAAEGLEKARAAQRQVTLDIADEKSAIDSTVQMAKDAAAEATERSSRNLRAQTAQEAIPDNFRVEVLKDVDLDDTEAVSKALKNWWQKDGFKVVKEREFNWDGQLADDVQRLFNDSPELLSALGEAPGMVAALERRFGMTEALEALKRGSPDGVPALEGLFGPALKIDGDALMEMRNVFARQANKGGDNAFAYQAVKNQFDKMIRSQLPESALEQFDDQLARWTTQRTYLDAARKGAKRGEGFTPKDWLGSSAKFGDIATGASPMKREATTALDQARSAAEKVKDVRREGVGLKKAAADPQRKFDAADVVEEARREVVDVGKAATPKGASGLSSLLTTKQMGDAAQALTPGSQGILGQTGTLLAGTGLGKLMSTQAGQRFMAGQTAAQKKIVELIRSGNVARAEQVLARELAREGGF